MEGGGELSRPLISRCIQRRGDFHLFRRIFLHAQSSSLTSAPQLLSFPFPPSYPLRFPCLFIRCIRFVGLREVSRGETSLSRAEWISPDYLVAPNRSESWHNGRACIMRHMSLCRCTIAMHPPLTCLAPDHRQLDKTARFNRVEVQDGVQGPGHGSDYCLLTGYRNAH